MIGQSGRSSPWQRSARSISVAQRRQRLGFALKLIGAGKGKPLHLRAGTAGIGPKAEQRADLLDREAEIAGIGDKPEAMEVALAIVTIASTPTRRRRDEADLFIMADHPLRDAALP